MTTVQNSLRSRNSYYAFTFVRFFAGFYCYAQEKDTTRM